MSDCRFGVSPVNYPDLDPDDAKIHATSARLYNVPGKLAGNENSFLPKYFDPDL